VDSQATGPSGGVGRGRREYRRKVLDLPDTEGRSRTGPGTSTSTLRRAIRGAGRTASRRGLVPGVTSPGIYVHRAVNRQHRPGHVRVRPPPSAPTAEDRRHRTPGGARPTAPPSSTPLTWDRGLVDRRVPVSCLGDERPWYGYRLATPGTKSRVLSPSTCVQRIPCRTSSALLARWAGEHCGLTGVHHPVESL